MKPRFSDRMGITQPPTSLQIGSINDPLRNSIWNLLLWVLNDWDSLRKAVTLIAREFLKVPLDKVPLYVSMEHRTREWLRTVYFNFEWYEVYNLLEFIAENSERINREWNPARLAYAANLILTREMSGYRLIEGTLAPISSEAEVEAIEEAVGKADTHGIAGVRTHLVASVKLLGQKPQPDYRNSIKEAISAVESAVKYITGTTGGGLDAALKELSKRVPVHAALADGLRKLYGYTSDADGIRHAILEEPNVGFDEAKFMLIQTRQVM